MEAVLDFQEAGIFHADVAMQIIMRPPGDEQPGDGKIIGEREASVRFGYLSDRMPPEQEE